jgi:hypothetical protein
MSKRKIFDELMEGVAAMKSHRRGKITLRTYRVEAAPLPKVDSKLIGTRERGCAVHELFLSASFGPTNEPWKNGNRIALSLILKPQRSFFWFASTPTPSNDWNESP